MPAAAVFLRAKCSDQQNACRLGPLRERCDPVERRHVTPMEIFEAKNQRAIRCCGFERICEFTQHASPRCASNGTPQRFVALWRQQRWQLSQPRRGISFEYRHKSRAAGLAAQSHECVEQRLIWLPDSIVLQTLPPSGSRPSFCRYCCKYLLSDRGLPNAGLPTEKQQLACASLRGRPDVQDVTDNSGMTDNRG